MEITREKRFLLDFNEFYDVEVKFVPKSKREREEKQQEEQQEEEQQEGFKIIEKKSKIEHNFAIPTTPERKRVQPTKLRPVRKRGARPKPRVSALGNSASNDKAFGNVNTFENVNSGFSGFENVNSGFSRFENVNSGFSRFENVNSGFGGFKERNVNSEFKEGDVNTAFSRFTEGETYSGFNGFTNVNSGFDELKEGNVDSESNVKIGAGFKVDDGFFGFGTTQNSTFVPDLEKDGFAFVDNSEVEVEDVENSFNEFSPVEYRNNRFEEKNIPSFDFGNSSYYGDLPIIHNRHEYVGHLGIYLGYIHHWKDRSPYKISGYAINPVNR
jgi:hypothetical protein